MRLTATFSTPLKGAIVLRGDGNPRTYSTKNGDFDIALTISPVEGARSKKKNERLWTYAADPGVRSFVVRGVHGERSELGVVKFEAKHHRPFRTALAKSRPPKLYEEILSDAQAAAFDGNVRRAVLELAIACEVFVKHAFLGGSGGTALVYEALEDKGKLNARVLDLIEIGGTARLGKTFRAVDKDAYTDIDHLFRARNKIAHRGEAAFRDDAGHLHTVDSKLLARWWRSTQRLFKWAG